MDTLSSLVEGIDASFWDAPPSPTPSPVTPTHDAGADDWDLEAAKPKLDALLANRSSSDPLTRCVVDDVDEADQWTKVLSVHVYKRDNDRRTVYLQDDWYDTNVKAGDTVNVLGHFQTPSTPITISSQSNMLVLHPDILLTATALSNAPQCRRKPMLSSLVRASNDISPALVWGNLLHEVMQRCLLQDQWDEKWIHNQIDDVISDNLGSLLLLNMSEETARATMIDRSCGLPHFKERYLGDTPKPTATLSDTRSSSSDKPSILAISHIHEIEEDIWSPKYGLKGKLDVTVEAVVAESSTFNQPPPPPRRNGFFSASSAHPPPGKSILPGMLTIPQGPSTTGPRPFEIKTGRTIGGMEHRAQTMLYTLLASERYGVEVEKGLLYYTQSQSGEIVQVPRGRNEIRGLMVIRNEIASWMMVRMQKNKPKTVKAMDVDPKPPSKADPEIEESFLPPAIDDSHACKRCYVLDACTLYRFSLSTSSPTLKALESPPPSDTNLAQTYQMKTEHLTSAHGEFFRKWEKLLSLEEQDLVRFKSELWRLGAQEREKRGRCFSGMVMREDCDDAPVLSEGGEEAKHAQGSKIHKFTYTFTRSQHFTFPPTQASAPSQTSTPAQNASLLNGHLSIGDAITISVDPHLLALVQGFILDLTPDAVKVGVDHSIDPSSIKQRLAILQRRNNERPLTASTELIFRIDKDELFGGMGRMRNNLAQLFYLEGDHARRELIVDLRPPLFSTSTPMAIDGKITGVLNESQRCAVRKVLSAEDYALILGMPGTGKTTVVAALIRVLVAMGKTILLASYTHSAVDSILRKLDEKGKGQWDDKVLRLGNVDKVHADARKYMLSGRPKAKTVAELEKQWMTPPVVAATCLGVDHPLFGKRKFDYCIVDEASQITLPTCLGPLRFASKFVLVGDHFQLPPLVKNPEARSGGLDVSLFRRLSDAHAHSVVDLNQQYRMNEEIMLLSNKLIYDDRLKCGNEFVARRALELPNPGALDLMHKRLRRRGEGQRCIDKQSCWLAHLTDPRVKAVFVDTDALGPAAYDSRAGDLVQNPLEADLAVQFISALVHCGVDQSQIGIISLYRQQVKLLAQKLVVEDDRGLDKVEVLTADKSQGRDKDCIVVSLVRSNAENQVGELVKDWRRMNVSFTRARSKLVIFGSRSTLGGDPLLAQFFALMEGQGWVYALPPGAHLAHGAATWGTNDEIEVDEADDDEVGTSPQSEDVMVTEASPQVLSEASQRITPLKRRAQMMEEETTDQPGAVVIEIDDEEEDVIPVEMVRRPSRKVVVVPDDDTDDDVIVCSEPVPQVRRAASSASLSTISRRSAKSVPVSGKVAAKKEKENSAVVSNSAPVNKVPKPEAPTTKPLPSKSKAGAQAALTKKTQSNLDDWFSRGKVTTPAVSAPSKVEDTANNNAEERPKKRVKGIASDPSLGKSGAAAANTVKGLLKGRPILQDLVKNET